MRRTITCLLLAAAATAMSAAPSYAYDWTIENSSAWDIHRVFISPCGNRYWGQDRLGERTIMRTGDRYVLRDVTRGCYDVKIVDEDGDSCVLNNVQISGDEAWEITNQNLLRCQSNN